MKREREPELDNPMFSKEVNPFARVYVKVLRLIGITLCLSMVAAAVGVYVVNAVRGTTTQAQFATCCVALVLLVAVLLCVKLVGAWKRWFYRRDIALDPATMALPERGTVTLEGALHKMSWPLGALMWFLFLGCLLCTLLLMLVFPTGQRAAILRGAAAIAALTIVGTLLLYLFWKKRSFLKRLVNCSAEYFPEEVNEGYAASVEASLRRGVLSYESELILTDDYILAAAGTVAFGTRYRPVAVPRAKVTEFVFYHLRLLGGRYTRTFGILSCRVDGEVLVNLVVGRPQKAQKVLRILTYYQIPWTEEPFTYL